MGPHAVLGASKPWRTHDTNLKSSVHAPLEVPAPRISYDGINNQINATEFLQLR